MNKKIKYAVIFAVALLACLGLLIKGLSKLGFVNRKDCVRIGSVSQQTPSKWSETHMSMDGTMTYTLNVKSGKLDVEIETKSGSIDIEIVDKNGDYAYRGKDLQDCSFVVETKGKVTITVKGADHEGSFSFIVRDK